MDVDVRLVTAMISVALNELAVYISQLDKISRIEICNLVWNFRKNGKKA